MLCKCSGNVLIGYNILGIPHKNKIKISHIFYFWANINMVINIVLLFVGNTRPEIYSY